MTVHPPRGPAAISGAISAAVAVGVTELAAGLLGTERSVLLAVGDAVVEATPGPVVQAALATLGGANRVVLLLTTGAVLLAAGALVGIAAARRAWTGPVAIALVAAAGAAAASADPLMPDRIALLAPAAGAVAGGLLLWGLLRAAAGPQAPTDGRTPAGSRRAFLTLAVGGLGAAALGGGLGRRLQAQAGLDEAREGLALPEVGDALPAPPAGASLDVEGITPLFTPNADFYRIDTALGVPRIDPATHTVRISGMVERPLELTLAELLELADVEADVTLACVSNEIGGDLVGNARWQGVALSDLLDRAGVADEADQIVGRSVDGWTGGFPVSAAYDGRPALVAVGMNGEPLPAEHGFPVRLVVAGLYGYVSDTKWLSHIELTTFDAFDAYWVPRGWSQRGPVKTQSRIDVPAEGARLAPGRHPVAGVAWAGVRGVDAVEVSIDDGPWRACELADELDETTWRQWRLAWDAEAGTHTISVRATDGTGQVQTADYQSPIPDGATGRHTVTVTVE